MSVPFGENMDAAMGPLSVSHSLNYILGTPETVYISVKVCVNNNSACVCFSLCVCVCVHNSCIIH